MNLSLTIKKALAVVALSTLLLEEMMGCALLRVGGRKS